MLVYLDGEFVPEADATVSVNDRGFLFGDGVYEVVRVYGGQLYLWQPHMQRMQRGLQGLRIDFDDFGALHSAAERLLDENEVDTDGTIYIQVTRGVAPRRHAFPPAGTPPTVYVRAQPISPHPEAMFLDGVDAITVSDNRWGRCDIKSTSLLPNVLANQAAHADGAFEALYVRDGIVLEGSHSNLWAVHRGRLITYPASNYILAGISRARVFEIAHELGIPATESLIHYESLYDLDELFLSGTTTEIMPVVRVDGREIVDGEPGPVTRKVQDAFKAALPG